MAKDDHVHEDRKVGGSNATPIKLFSADYYYLNSNLVMISSLPLKWQGHPTGGPLAN